MKVRELILACSVITDRGGADLDVFVGHDNRLLDISEVIVDNKYTKSVILQTEAIMYGMEEMRTEDRENG